MELLHEFVKDVDMDLTDDALVSLYYSIRDSLVQWHTYWSSLSTAPHLFQRKWNKVSKYRNKLKRRWTPLQTRTRSRLISISDLDCYTYTGLYIDYFEEIFQKVQSLIVMPRSTFKRKARGQIHRRIPERDARFRLFVVLSWCKSGKNLVAMSEDFGISRSTVSCFSDTCQSS